MSFFIGRRGFITLRGSVALTAPAQQPMSVVGFLDSRSADNSPHSSLAAYLRSLATMAERGMPCLTELLKGVINMMFHSRAARTTILATGSALALMTAALGDRAHAESNLDASYTISFARIRVGDITATVAFGDSEYAISANGRAGGVVKILLDGEGSFTTRGNITDSHPVPTKFTSKIVSNTGNSDVTMVLDEGSVKELAAAPLPSSGRVPVTEANRQGIVDPLTAMLFSAAPAGDGLSQQACRHTLPIFDGHQRYDLKLAFKRMDKVTAEKGYAGPVVVCSLRYEPIAGHSASNTLVKYLSEGREMEIALAPIAGTRLLAPFRLSVVSMLANIVIEANQFETTARPLDTSTVADPKGQ